MNTLDLDPEWGAIDLLEDIETVFGFEITKEEAERCATLGDLYAVICARVPDWDGRSGKCASSMAFYRVRRSLDPDRRQGITPQTTLTECGRPAELFKEIARETRLRLPAFRLTPIGMAGSQLLAGGVLATIITLLAGQWTLSGFLIAASALGIALIWMNHGKLPEGVATVGDLVRRTALLNARELQADGARLSDRWSVLAALAAEHGSLTPDEITPETFFHRKSLAATAAA